MPVAITQKSKDSVCGVSPCLPKVSVQPREPSPTGATLLTPVSNLHSVRNPNSSAYRSMYA
eukprot:7379107-Prymnesium_polylepis.2